jgi:predicted dehydrogenase
MDSGRNVTLLSIGIVGAGEITRRSHLPVLINMPGSRIAWLYDQRAARAEALAGAYGIRALHSLTPERLPPCDVVLLAIPVGARAPYLQHFAWRGTAVLCEKPFALSGAEHQRILSEFAPHAIACGFMRRCFKSTVLLRQIVRTNIFGPLLKISISEGNRSKGSGADSSYLDDPMLGTSRGVLTDLGSHSVDLALHISGAQSFDVLSSARVMDGDVDRKVTARVNLSCSSEGAPPVQLDYAVSWLDRQENQVRLTFERTTVWSDLSVSATVKAGDPTHPEDALLFGSEMVGASTYNQAFFLEWKHFLDGVRTCSESLVSARSAALTSTLVEALLTWGRSTHD